MVRVLMPGADPKTVFAAIQPLAHGYQNPDGTYSALVFDFKKQFDWPVTLTISAEEVIVGDSERLPVERVGVVSASIVTGDGFCHLTFYPWDGGEDSEFDVYVPPESGDEIIREWEMRRVRRQVAKASMAELYVKFNETRKRDLLTTLFIDILLLDRKLNESAEGDYPMEELVEFLEEKGEVEFAKDKEKQAAMLKRILLLTMMLPEIKQKFEVLTTMYPYYWLHREERWLEQALGVDPKSKGVEAERRRLVPLIRREVRAVQSNNQRALAEMETVARSLDAVLARQETHDHWQAKVRKFVPMGLQGLFAGGLVVFSGGTNPAAWNMLGNFLASGVLGNVCAVMLQDMEAMTQIQRVAKTLFPWWRVFMSTSVVSIYEASQFVDAQNIAAMQRDKALLDQVPEADRPAAIQRLEAALRERIVAERKSLLTDMLADNTVRLESIVEDIEYAVEVRMQREINKFVSDMTISISTPEPLLN
ncbi:MAG TPA: hypothetical protein VK961_24885 [Chthoniobacter sp.]|nr:hypothetical protein [Chthoniobacter sp.]